MKWLLQTFFDWLYHPLAWSYDLIAWLVSAGRWKGWVRSILPLMSGVEILELGSGTGTLQIALAEAGYRTAAVDESRQMLRIVKRKMEAGDLARRSRLIRGRAESLPLPSGSADTIAATFPSEYIGRVETITECRRVLRHGGKLVVLLGVEIGGRGVYDLFLRGLYAVTLQKTPPLSILEKSLVRLRFYGFQARIETLDFRQDRLTIIVAE